MLQAYNYNITSALIIIIDCAILIMFHIKINFGPLSSDAENIITLIISCQNTLALSMHVQNLRDPSRTYPYNI